MFPLAQGLCSEHWAHTPLARLQSIPLGVQSLSESQAARQTFCRHRRAEPQSESVLHSTHRPDESQTLPCPQLAAPPSVALWQVAAPAHRLERQLCPVGQSVERTHCTHKPRLGSQTKSGEAQSRLSPHPWGLTHPPALQLRPEGQSVSTVQVSFCTLTVPPVLPPALEPPESPVVDPPAPAPAPESPPDAPAEAPAAELTTVWPPLELLLDLPLLELPPLDDPLFPPEPPELAEEDEDPAPLDS
jgi:hypothetical protein